MVSLDLTAPTSWNDLSQEQLRLLLKVMVAVQQGNATGRFASADDYSAQTTAQIAVICLLRWNNVGVLTPYADGWLLAHDGHEYAVDAESLASASTALSWLSAMPSEPVRLDSVAGGNAVKSDLSEGFPFEAWLACENIWQGYISTGSDEALRQMAEILYNTPGIKPEPYELLGVFYWWAAVKSLFTRRYPYFFKPAEATEDDGFGGPDSFDARRNVEAQIRALTKGDITKRQQILELESSWALAELDALAREYDELNRKYPKK